jgi:hypothetical protein
MPTAPSFGPGRMPSPAEMRKYQAEVERARNEAEVAAKQAQANAQTMQTIAKFFIWLASLAPIAGFAAFAFFLGVVGEALGAAQARLLAIYYCGLEGACELWATVSAFVIDMATPMMVRLNMVLWIILTLAT